MEHELLSPAPAPSQPDTLDYFAGQPLIGLLASGKYTSTEAVTLAFEAYKIAETMIQYKKRTGK